MQKLHVEKHIPFMGNVEMIFLKQEFDYEKSDAETMATGNKCSKQLYANAHYTNIIYLLHKTFPIIKSFKHIGFLLRHIVFVGCNKQLFKT